MKDVLIIKKIWIIGGLALAMLVSCNDSNESEPQVSQADQPEIPTDPPKDVEISFATGETITAENNSAGVKVLMMFSSPIEKAGSFRVTLTPGEEAAYGVDFITVPSGEEGVINFTASIDSSSASFRVIPIDNQDFVGDKLITFNIKELTGGLILGQNLTKTLIIKENEALQEFAFTSFEEPETTIDIQYFDVNGPADVDHDLINNPNEPPVDYVSVGGELGFDAKYVNTRNDVGLTEGDFAGVTKATIVVNEFADGTQGYEMSDTDGKMILAFDELDISSFLEVNVALDVYLFDLKGDGIEYEENDILKIYLIIDGDTQLDIFNSAQEIGERLDETYPELLNTWTTVAGTTTFGSKAKLLVEFDSNSPNEILYLDNVKFTGLK